MQKRFSGILLHNRALLGVIQEFYFHHAPVCEIEEGYYEILRSAAVESKIGFISLRFTGNRSVSERRGLVAVKCWGDLRRIS